MASKSINSKCLNDSVVQDYQAEILEALLQYDESPYPWNPAIPEAEAYFTQLETEFDLEDYTDEEITERSTTLFAQIEKCWPSQTSPAIVEIQTTLYQRFAAHVPHLWLDAIAQKATELISTELSITERLVQCVRDLLPNWQDEDLQVLARPFAYAMRGTDTETDSKIKTIDWTNLSEIERARLSMAIARSALSELTNSTTSEIKLKNS